MLIKRRARVTNNHGFTIGSLIVLLLLAGTSVLAYKFIVRSQKDNTEQAKKISNALIGEDDAEETSDDEDRNSKSYTDQSQLWENPIRSVDVKVEPLTITFTATLPGSYKGTCTLEIGPLGSDEKRRFVETLKGTRTCSIYVPANELKEAKTWRYQFGYFSSDGRTYGKYPEGALSL